MGRKRKARRQQHGSAWHWKQTNAWYYALPGKKKRMPLFDEIPIRADVAKLLELRLKAADKDAPAFPNPRVSQMSANRIQSREQASVNLSQ
jgi:hypothetical protein